jgi:hypothetical protein
MMMMMLATDALVSCLQVKPSSIPGAGEGLFTTVDLPALKPLVLYYGELRQGKAQGRYCIQVGPCLTQVIVGVGRWGLGGKKSVFYLRAFFFSPLLIMPTGPECCQE